MTFAHFSCVSNPGILLSIARLSLALISSDTVLFFEVKLILSFIS
jgi:hypothetical protein